MHRSNDNLSTMVTRNPTCGPVEGFKKAGMASFLGIPFAMPPVGTLRFMAPEAVKPWSKLYDASAYGPTAPQPNRDFTLIPEPEEADDNYLNLNVFAPAKLPNKPLPVLIYIHGGGYSFGCNRSPWFEGDSFVRNGVILVTPNYRLNVEGFMPLEGAPHNRALLDWVAALKWVRNNIDAFGGDPDNVTLSGQSAGGGAVATLLASPIAKGHFNKAIMFSGSIGFGGSMKRARDFAERFSKAVDRPLTVKNIAKLSRQELIAGHMKATKDPLAEGLSDGFLRNIRLGMPLQPIPDTDSLPLLPSQAFARGASKDIPILVTTTKDEFVFEFEPFGTKITDKYLSQACAKFNLKSEDVQSVYPSYNNARLLGQLATDLLMRAPMIEMADIRKSVGAAATWTAEFRHQSSVWMGAPMRAAHCLDMPFYFDKLSDKGATKVCGQNLPQELADSMHISVVNFTKGEIPNWAPWRKKRLTKVWDWPQNQVTNDLDDVYKYTYGSAE